MSIESRHGVDEPPVDDAPEPSLEPPEEPRRWHERWSWRLLILLALVLVFAGWRAGTFDRVLVNVGLNAKPCERNALGATFCGQELAEYDEHVAQIKRQAGEAGERLEREGREAEAKAQEQERSSREALERGADGSG
jgi:hypothetical protein